jgi:transcriptional regulator with XRE-family HTH domain
MREPDPKTTLREFREYLALSYQAQHQLAARIGVTPSMPSDWLAGERQPMGKSFGEALEVAKRQKCKYANSIRTRATDDRMKSTSHIVRDIGFPK